MSPREVFRIAVKIIGFLICLAGLLYLLTASLLFIDPEYFTKYRPGTSGGRTHCGQLLVRYWRGRTRPLTPGLAAGATVWYFRQLKFARRRFHVLALQ
jgi:hypothetical protein